MVSTAAPAWEHPDSLDALAAAPGFHRLLLENDHLRVLETRIAPGATVPVHTHRWPSVLYVLSGGRSIRRDGSGNLLGDPRSPETPAEQGTALWLEPIPPHTVENVGDSEIRLLNVELKRAGS
jgi:mannose-6-phosphate isomerase-like protein (cupin superfamily)